MSLRLAFQHIYTPAGLVSSTTTVMLSYAIPIFPSTAPYLTICKHVPSHVLKYAKVGDYCQNLFWAMHQICPEFLHALAELLCMAKHECSLKLGYVRCYIGRFDCNAACITLSV